MLKNWLPQKKEGLTLTVNITGLSANDYKFLKAVTAIFTDPSAEPFAKAIRSGNFAIQYNPKNGDACMTDLGEAPVAATPVEAVSFLARFNQAEWDIMKPHQTQLHKKLGQSVEAAEKFTKSVLGWLPKPSTIAIGGE